MHANPITSAALLTLAHLLGPAQPHVLPSSFSPSSQLQTCPSRTSPQSFSLRDITYLHYETAPNTPTPQPNTTQLVFEVTNSHTGISTGCALQIVPRPEKGDDVETGDDDDEEQDWFTCLERTTSDEKSYPVKTSAHVDWDVWRLSVKQTWVCEESITINQFSAMTLAPTCTESRTGSQYIKECLVPDMVVAATFDSTD
ncbi:hypothetical protein F4808DRAFT_459805 [Astrocystis sublimbata]|nr:hypothetical protein F4808DRAFT_459805 [Astrocystis sublimbata]